MLQAPQEHRVQAASPQLFPSPPAKALMSVSRICACKPCSLGCFSYGVLPRPSIPAALLQVPGAAAGCAAAASGCCVVSGSVPALPNGAAWGPLLKPGDGDSCMGSVLWPSTRLAEQKVTGTLRAASFTGCLPCSTSSLFFTQLQRTVTLGFTTPRPGSGCQCLGITRTPTAPVVPPGSQDVPSTAPPHSALGLGVGGRRACSCHSPREQPLLHPPPQTRSSSLPPPLPLPLCHQLLSRAMPDCSFQLRHILASACHLLLGQCHAACPSPGHPVRHPHTVGCSHVLPAAGDLRLLQQRGLHCHRAVIPVLLPQDGCRTLPLCSSGDCSAVACSQSAKALWRSLSRAGAWCQACSHALGWKLDVSPGTDSRKGSLWQHTQLQAECCFPTPTRAR